MVDAINAGSSHVAEEPGLAELVAAAHAGGRLRATTDGAAAARAADVVVLIVPVMLDDEQQPGLPLHGLGRRVDRAGRPRRLARDLRDDAAGRRHPRTGSRRGSRRSGLPPDEDLFVAFSPERLYSGAAIRNLATYPKLVGGIGPASTARAAAFYDAVLDTEIVAMSNAEAAEFSKLADTTYRDVNIALANEFARYAERVGVDIHEVIAAANSQPYSHIHQPGLGVGGHCIPVYPHFLLSRAPELELVELSRRTNDGQVGVAIKAIQQELGGLEGVPVLVLGLTYRDGVHELAYSRALPLIERLSHLGAVVLRLGPAPHRPTRSRRCGATPWTWGEPAPFRAIVSQTADPLFAAARPRVVPGPGASSSTGATASAGWPCRSRSPIAGSACRRERASRPPARLPDEPRRARAALADRQRRRDAPPADQGGGAVAGAPARPRGGPRRHRPALGRRDGRRVLPRARPAAAGPLPGDRRRDGGRAGRADAAGPGAGAPPSGPDAVLVYGDTNSTLAGGARRGEARAARRARRGRAALVRSRRMPEEVNRVVADHLSTWLFAPTPHGGREPGGGGDRRRRRRWSAT